MDFTRLCRICGAALPHRDPDQLRSCAHVTTIVTWREEGYIDVTDFFAGIDVAAMLRAAGVEVRELPGRPDRFWAPSWAAQIAAMTRLKGFTQHERIRVITCVNSNAELRAAAEAVMAADELVLVVLGHAIQTTLALPVGVVLARPVLS